jgi:outer membrane lipoprotein LolB
MKLPGRWALMATIFLTACAHVPLQVADGLTFDQRRARLEAASRWTMRGRIAVVAGNDGFNGRFSWRQLGNALDLRVRGPLGAGAVAIHGDSELLTVTARGAETPVTITNPEAELPALLGWWVPVRSVPNWLLGIPDDDYPASESFDADGLVAVFFQRGWRVQVQRYQISEDILIPAQLQLDYGDLRLKLIIDGWVVDELD